MSFVLTGYFSQAEADLISALASESDALGYPPVASFEEDEETDRWRVDLYLENLPEETLLSEALGDFATRLETEELPDDTNWVLEGLKDLKPVRVGRFFVHGSHDNELVQPHHHSILIDANMAFGTGHHGTTSGCLQAIQDVTRRRDYMSILDLGTGSGVLAIALAKELRQPVLATDIDPISVKIARDNMRLNGVSNLVFCETAAGFHHPVFNKTGPFDLVVANILAGPLCALAHPMTNHLSANATIILSGLLIGQKAQVLSAYRNQGAYLERAIHLNGWATLILTRP